MVIGNHWGGDEDVQAFGAFGRDFLGCELFGRDDSDSRTSKDEDPDYHRNDVAGPAQGTAYVSCAHVYGDDIGEFDGIHHLNNHAIHAIHNGHDGHDGSLDFGQEASRPPSPEEVEEGSYLRPKKHRRAQRLTGLYPTRSGGGE